MSNGASLSASVALCTFNGARYLETQLRSILAQDRVPDEIVVCDDGSTDDTLAIAERCLGSASVPYRVERNGQRLGSSANFGRAFGMCRGDVIVPSDQDDRWHPNKLGVLLGVFERSPDTAMTFSNARMIDEGDAPLGYTQWQSTMFGPAEQALTQRGDFLAVLSRYPVVCGATMAFRRSVLDLVLPIEQEWVQDEWISWLCAATSHVQPVAEPLIDYRHHSAQQIGAARMTLWRQLNTARRMNTSYFEGQVRRFTRLLGRLQEWEGPVHPGALARIEGKLAYQKERVHLRHAPGQRWRASTQALLRGDHRRFGLGLKSWLFDLGHPYVPPSK